MTGENAGHSHIGIPNCLDLFDSVELGCFVEPSEKAVEERKYLGWIAACGDGCETDDVSKEHRGLRVAVCNGGLATLEPLRDRTGKNVQQQIFVLTVFLFNDDNALLDAFRHAVKSG